MNKIIWGYGCYSQHYRLVMHLYVITYGTNAPQLNILDEVFKISNLLNSSFFSDSS